MLDQGVDQRVDHPIQGVLRLRLGGERGRQSQLDALEHPVQDGQIELHLAREVVEQGGLAEARGGSQLLESDAGEGRPKSKKERFREFAGREVDPGIREG